MIVLVVRAALSAPMISMTMTPHVPAAVRLWTMTITTRTARFAAARSRQSDDDDHEDRPVRPALAASMDMDDDDEDRPVRRRPRRAVADTHAGHSDERLLHAVAPPSATRPCAARRMTSLLFQEPRSPAAVDAHDTADTRDDDVDDDGTSVASLLPLAPR